MTANEMIQGALRLIGVIRPGETPTAAESTDGLEALNHMLHEWPMDLQHEDLALTDDLRVPPDHLRAIRYALAVEVAPEYGRQVPAPVAAIAEKTGGKLRNRYVNPSRLDTRQFGNRPYSIERDQ